MESGYAEEDLFIVFDVKCVWKCNTTILGFQAKGLNVSSSMTPYFLYKLAASFCIRKKADTFSFGTQYT